MAEIVFYCPNVDLSVQHLLDDNTQRGDEEIYEAILCFACTRLHFVNKKTGKLLEQTDWPQHRGSSRDAHLSREAAN